MAAPSLPRSRNGEIVQSPQERLDDLDYANRFTQEAEATGLYAISGHRNSTESNFYAAVVTQAERETALFYQNVTSLTAHLLGGSRTEFVPTTKVSWGTIKHFSSYCEGQPSRYAALLESQDIFDATELARQAEAKGLYVEFGRLEGAGARCYALALTEQRHRVYLIWQNQRLRARHNHEQIVEQQSRQKYGLPLNQPQPFVPVTRLDIEAISQLIGAKLDNPGNLYPSRLAAIAAATENLASGQPI